MGLFEPLAVVLLGLESARKKKEMASVSKRRERKNKQTSIIKNGT